MLRKAFIPLLQVCIMFFLSCFSYRSVCQFAVRPYNDLIRSLQRPDKVLLGVYKCGRCRFPGVLDRFVTVPLFSRGRGPRISCKLHHLNLTLFVSFGQVFGSCSGLFGGDLGRFLVERLRVIKRKQRGKLRRKKTGKFRNLILNAIK